MGHNRLNWLTFVLWLWRWRERGRGSFLVSRGRERERFAKNGRESCRNREREVRHKAKEGGGVVMLFSKKKS
jgi:hypothetical protein